jgi:hypothetical protein
MKAWTLAPSIAACADVAMIASPAGSGDDDIPPVNYKRAKTGCRSRDSEGRDWTGFRATGAGNMRK